MAMCLITTGGVCMSRGVLLCEIHRVWGHNFLSETIAINCRVNSALDARWAAVFQWETGSIRLTYLTYDLSVRLA